MAISMVFIFNKGILEIPIVFQNIILEQYNSRGGQYYK